MEDAEKIEAAPTSAVTTEEVPKPAEETSTSQVKETKDEDEAMEDDEPKKDENPEPPMRKVDEDENYDDE